MISDNNSVWLVCMVGGKIFPNPTVLGVYSSEEKMIATVKGLPRENSYNIYRAPLDQFCGYWHKSGTLLDGMGRLYHFHLTPPDQDGPHSGWTQIDNWRPGNEPDGAE